MDSIVHVPETIILATEPSRTPKVVQAIKHVIEEHRKKLKYVSNLMHKIIDTTIYKSFTC